MFNLIAVISVDMIHACNLHILLGLIASVNGGSRPPDQPLRIPPTEYEPRILVSPVKPSVAEVYACV